MDPELDSTNTEKWIAHQYSLGGNDKEAGAILESDRVSVREDDCLIEELDFGETAASFTRSDVAKDRILHQMMGCLDGVRVICVDEQGMDRLARLRVG